MQVSAPIRTMFGTMQQTYLKRVPVILKSPSVTINVLPLPHTDKSFWAEVGHYSIKVSTDKNSVKANDAITLTGTITGEGNIKLIDSLPFQFPADFDHYDPKITDKISVTNPGVSGSRTFTYVLIPRHQGKYTIPATEFTYFDPARKEYVTLKLDEMSFDVAKGDNNSATMTVNGSYT